MTFNSIQYALFLPLAFLLYWLPRKRLEWQNAVLLVSSYIFYGAWDYRFLSLLIISTLVDFYVGRRLAIAEVERSRRMWLSLSLIVNLGILGFFKYFDFFVESAAALLIDIGFEPNITFLRITLPVGISFYTFQTISYTYDIYRERMSPTDSLLNFAVYVAFFPQLVAGPIERARRLLPQVESPRSLSDVDVGSGLNLIFLGLFKKVAIADVMGGVANDAFANAGTESALTLMMGVYAFSLQIYGDFSGYTDIARGSARLFGIELMENFRQPYLSRNITEFWRTWHISLSNWLRDYLYIPLGGNREGRWRTYRNLMITMLLGGLWHGAGWNFVVWGGLHGLYLSVHRQFRDRADAASMSSTSMIAGILLTFHIVSVTWIFFRAESFSQAWDYLEGIVTLRPGEMLESHLALLVPAVAVIATIDILQRLRSDELFFMNWGPAAQGTAYALMFVSLVIFSGGQPTPFIYFQF